MCGGGSDWLAQHAPGTYGALHPPRWTSVAAMLADIAQALENGTEIDDFMPIVKDGVLDWEID